MGMSLSPDKLRASPWLFLSIGLAAMFVPVYWWAANSIWQSEEQGHGGLIFIVVLWLLWEQRHALRNLPAQPLPQVGWPCFVLGLLLYAVGRLFHISILELGAQIPVFLGVLFIMQGWPAVRVLWFPLAYIVFMIPLPGMLVDAVTGPLKQWISVIAENVLYHAGYPVARQGVMISIGQYQLLVADACSGLNSMFSLSALGVLFLYLRKRTGVLHNLVMIASILPIAFFANIVRVMTLVLITYHFGDAAGQGFMHGTAGILLMLVALLVFFVLDRLLFDLLGRLGRNAAAAGLK